MENIMFRFVFYKKQINAIRCLFYKQKDLLFLAKIRFDKSFIFQLLSFIPAVADEIFILMLVRFFQARQGFIIN